MDRKSSAHHSNSPNKKSVMKTDPNNLNKKAGESTVIKSMGLMKIDEGGKRQEGYFDG